MNITRHNYEEYFILYLDNELSEEERREVELFAQENPDLQQELDSFLNTRVVPEAAVVFDGKESLLRDGSTNIISLANYDEWLALYIDNELSPAEKIKAGELIANHPTIRAELALLEKTKLQPEPIVFRNKEVLYRSTEKVRVVSIQWRRIAVAAVLLLTCGTAIFLASTRNDETKPGVAITQPKPKATAPAIETITQPAQNDQEAVATTNPVLAEGELSKNEIANNTVASATHEVKKENTSRTNQTTKEEVVIAATADVKNKTNNLPSTENNPNVNPAIVRDNPIAKIDLPENKDLTNSKENNLIVTVTPGNTSALDNVMTAVSKEPADLYEEEQPGKKNKLRGFFRKVTRTIEKRTNIKATDDENRLLLAGFSVKL